MADSPDDLLPGPRILLGPGPTMADPRVLRAMATPLLGQFDPEFTAVMNEVMDLLRVVFQTRNERAFPVPGTGRAGLEAAMVSLLEPGDRVVVGECGRFGLLLIDIAERCGAEVVPVRAEWGRIVEPEAIARALDTGRTRMVAMIHGETSTGVLQPLAEIGRLAHTHDALLMADAVVTLGGSEVATDDWGVDVMVAGTQKCLSCPSPTMPARRACWRSVRAAYGATIWIFSSSSATGAPPATTTTPRRPRWSSACARRSAPSSSREWRHASSVTASTATPCGPVS